MQILPEESWSAPGGVKVDSPVGEGGEQPNKVPCIILVETRPVRAYCPVWRGRVYSRSSLLPGAPYLQLLLFPFLRRPNAS